MATKFFAVLLAVLVLLTSVAPAALAGGVYELSVNGVLNLFPGNTGVNNTSATALECTFYAVDPGDFVIVNGQVVYLLGYRDTRNTQETYWLPTGSAIYIATDVSGICEVVDWGSLLQEGKATTKMRTAGVQLHEARITQ